MSDPSCNEHFFSFYNAVPWIIVIIGWLVVNKQNNTRETRKEIRAALDKITVESCRIEDAAIKYHTAGAHDEYLARDLKYSISRLHRVLTNLGFLQEGNISALIRELRKAITLNNFDTPHHEPQDLRGGIITEISSEVDRLIDFLEREYRNKYK